MPDTWSAADGVAWKTEIPGRGWSSPIVWGERVFITTAIKEGGEPEPVKKGLYFGGNRPAPKEAYRWMVYCLDLDSGKIVWEKDVHRGVPKHGHHYVVNDNEKESFFVALNKKTGKRIWRVQRDEKSNWATPFVWKNEKRTEIVTPGTGKIRSYGLDGQLLWELGGMSVITIPTPFAEHGLLYVTSGYVMDRRKPLFAIRPGAVGDISLQEDQTGNEHIAWCQKKAGPYNPSPIVYGKRRIGPGARAFTSSPWAYDGKIFCLSEDGDTFVIRTGPAFELLGKNSLGELCMATPAVVRDGLIIRTESNLFRIK